MTATAQVIEMPDSGERDEKETEALHPLTVVIHEAVNDHGLADTHKIAAWIVDHRGSFWDECTRDQKISLLVKLIRGSWPRSPGDKRRKALHAELQVDADADANGRRRAYMRMTANGPAGWSSTWPEVNNKTTRELDTNDIEILKRRYRERIGSALVRIRWFELLQDLMRKHRCKVAGELEKKGVKLPSAEAEVGE